MKPNAGTSPDPTYTGQRISLEGFERSTDPPEFKLELVDGMLVREPAPGGRHGVVHTSLIVALKREAGPLAFVVTEAGFVLDEDPPTVRRPDVGLVLRSGQPDGVPVGLFHRPPDLAVEVVSPSNTAAEIQRKVAEYVAAGTHAVWVAYPATRTVVVHRPDGTAQTVADDGVLELPDLAPDLRIPVAEVFEE